MCILDDLACGSGGITQRLSSSLGSLPALKPVFVTGSIRSELRLSAQVWGGRGVTWHFAESLYLARHCASLCAWGLTQTD